MYATQGKCVCSSSFPDTLNHAPATDPCAPDGAIPGEQHHFVQDRQLVTVLLDYNAPNYRGDGPLISDSSGVGAYRIPVIVTSLTSGFAGSPTLRTVCSMNQ